MNLFPKRKTDEEYVEAARKLVVRSKWIGVLEALAAIICLVSYLGVNSFYVWLNKLQYGPGVLIGIIYGASGGLIISLAIVNMIQCFKGRRAERLMLKYHDELKEKKTITNPPSDCG